MDALLALRLPLNIRLFDTLLTFFALWILFYLLQILVGKFDYGLAVFSSMLLAALITFPLAIFFHAIFGVPTALNCALRLAPYHKCIEQGFLPKTPPTKLGPKPKPKPKSNKK